jgi:aromatic ring-opening dioxygenase LigB subunit
MSLKNYYETYRSLGNSKDDAFEKALVASIREDEQENLIEYDDARVKQCVVHTREDVILLVKALSDVRKDVRLIRTYLWLTFLLIVGMSAYAVYQTLEVGGA